MNITIYLIQSKQWRQKDDVDKAPKMITPAPQTNVRRCERKKKQKNRKTNKQNFHINLQF